MINNSVDLTAEQIQRIVEEYIRTLKIGKESFKDEYKKNWKFYREVQSIAAKLKFIGSKESLKIGIIPDIKDDIYIQICDKVWEYVINGYLAPSVDRSNSWISDIHLTKKGLELKEKLNKETNKSPLS